MGANHAKAQEIQVTVNGDPVHFNGIRPRMIDGRVLVPLRGVLEKMGATVGWLQQSQTVVADKGQMDITLPIGSHTAQVNGRQVSLDVPAMVIAGSTMVPLRFVSEALGANVDWSNATETVAINLPDNGGSERPTPPADEHFRAYRNRGEYRRVLPAGTVIPLQLDKDLSSNGSVAGDRFTATVQSGEAAGGLPEGTRVEGVVREAIPAHNGRPGILDLQFRTIVLPAGATRAVSGTVINLDSKNIVRTASGRLIAQRGNNEQMKWVGIGAGAGLLIGAATRGNVFLDTLMGSGAGYLYNQLREKGASNVHLSAGTTFGMRLNQDIAFARE
jgi:hypothetical protein